MLIRSKYLCASMINMGSWQYWVEGLEIRLQKFYAAVWPSHVECPKMRSCYGVDSTSSMRYFPKFPQNSPLLLSKYLYSKLYIGLSIYRKEMIPFLHLEENFVDFNLIYWTPMSGSYLMKKCGFFWKNGRFSGRKWPDWGNTTWADMAGLGSKGPQDILVKLAFFSLYILGLNIHHKKGACISAYLSYHWHYLQSNPSFKAEIKFHDNLQIILVSKLR